IQMNLVCGSASDATEQAVVILELRGDPARAGSTDAAVKELLATKAEALKSKIDASSEGRRCLLLEKQLASIRENGTEVEASIAGRERALDSMLNSPRPGQQEEFSTIDAQLVGLRADLAGLKRQESKLSASLSDAQKSLALGCKHVHDQAVAT